MHASSLENMQLCYEKYICGDYFLTHESIKILDIGGANVNGSYTDIFTSEKFNYVAVDISPGPGIDVVLEDPYKLPFETGSIDIVISGQAFEHVEYFWLLFDEMSRVIKSDGWIFLIAPSAGPIHRYPVDCYRFYPDAWRALAKYSKLQVVEIYQDPRGPWQDLVGVFSKQAENIKKDQLSWQPPASAELNRYLAQRRPANTEFGEQFTEQDEFYGEVPSLDVLRALHEKKHFSNYLEIGVRKGGSLSLARCPAIAIDPAPDINLEEFPQVSLYKMSSDHFFANQSHIDFQTNPIELAFIDGMHLFEFVLRDFINVEARCSKKTKVIIDDIFPNNSTQAFRSRESKVWCGDVWKIIVCLKRYRPDLKLEMLDCSPTGLLIIDGLDSSNQTLTANYNPIIREFKDVELDEYKPLVFERNEAISPSTWIQEILDPA